MNPELFDPPGVGVKHFELQTRFMTHQFAAHGHAPGQREHQAAKRIDVLITLRRNKGCPEPLRGS